MKYSVGKEYQDTIRKAISRDIRSESVFASDFSSFFEKVSFLFCRCFFTFCQINKLFTETILSALIMQTKKSDYSI